MRREEKGAPTELKEWQMNSQGANEERGQVERQRTDIKQKES